MTGAGARRKGSAAERAVVAYLRANGFPSAERRLSGGPDDRGDIAELGPGLVLEVKDRQQAKPSVWADQLQGEMEAADADVGAVIWKRAGITDVSRWHAQLPVELLIQLLRDAGWGDPR